jgi:hypothetical protein
MPLLTLAVLPAGCGYERHGAMESYTRVPALQLPRDSRYAPINGISVHYQVHGREDGVPLVLLHGGSTIDVTFSRVLPGFAASRQVIESKSKGADALRPATRPRSSLLRMTSRHSSATSRSLSVVCPALAGPGSNLNTN